jgi:hypothetical protein
MLPTVYVLAGSFESFEPKPVTLGTPVPTLRNVREGWGTHNCGSFGDSKSWHPPRGPRMDPPKNLQIGCRFPATPFD